MEPKKKKIGLLIEDNAADARLMMEFLKSEWGPDLQIKNAQTLQGTLTALNNKNYDFILLDLSLPDSTGYNTFLKVKRNCHQTPILIMTGLDDQKLAEVCVKEGAQDYLVKGQFDSITLTKAINFSIRRKEYIKNVQISEKSFQNIIEKNSDGIIIADSEGFIRYANPAIENILEEKTNKVVGRRFDNPLVPGEESEVHMLRRGKSAKVVSMVVVEVEWEGSKAYLGSLRDITKKKKGFEKELKQSEEKFRQLFEKSNDGIIVYDLSGNIIDANQKGKDLLGLTNKDVTIENIFKFLKDKNTEPHPAQSDFLPNRNEERFEAIVKKRNGGHFYADITTSIIETEKGKVIQSVIRDITQRMALETQLKKANHELLNLEKIKNSLVHSLVHDIRGPLTSSRGTFGILLEMIKQKKIDLPESIIKQIQTARRSCDLQMRLIDDILDVNRMETNQFPLEKETIKISKVIEECIDIAKPMAYHKNMEIRASGNENDTLHIDEGIIERVIINLLHNAIKFSPPEKMVSIEYKKNQDNKFEICIEDNGMGIKEDELEKIFNKYYQVNTHEKSRKGNGLGLAFCKMAIEAHGGQIRAENKEPNGTRFIISLPLLSQNLK